LYEWFRVLGSRYSDVMAHVVVLAEVRVHLAQVLAGGLVCLAWGMLFVVAAKGRLLIVKLDEFGLWWKRNDMPGSKTEVVSNMLIGALA
jgi:hypothetical protein